MAVDAKYIGKYLILKKIAKGGMGAIFLAKHPTLNRKVILKKLTLRGSAEIKARFKREAEIMMDLKNDFIVNVYDHFKEGSFFYLVIEYIEGLSLDTIILRDGALDSYDAGLIAYDVARALLYIHSKGIIHRDIKPGNILISKNGQVKLTDFGIASLGADDDIDNKSKMEMLGTPAYMSPEQLENFSETDVKSDIYSFGVVLYEMLTGLKPFMGELNSRFFSNIKKGKYYRIHKMNKEASIFLSKVSRKGMHRKRSRRYSSFEDIISKLYIFIKKNRDRISRKSLASLTEGSKDGIEFKKQLARKIVDKELRIKKKRLIILKVSLTLFLSALLGMSFIIGLPYKALGSYKTGGFSIALPKHGNVRPESKKIKIYKELGKELEEVRLPLYFVQRDNMYTSIPVAISVGQYRVKYSIFGKVICSSFFIDSYDKRAVNILKISINKINQNKLKTSFKFYNVVSGKDLTDNSKLYIKSGSSYINLDKVDLYSGQRYMLKVVADGYYTDHYSITTDIMDNEYALTSGLIPKPGILTIKTVNGRSNIYINGEKYYLKGGTDQSYTKNGMLYGSREFILNPGSYTIQVGSKSSKGRRVIIRSNQGVKLEYPLDWE